jgi:hypothetical protein
VVNKPTKRQQKYWDKILHDHRLGKDRGQSSLVDYRGGHEDLNNIERGIVSKKTGRTRPKRQSD